MIEKRIPGILIRHVCALVDGVLTPSVCACERNLTHLVILRIIPIDSHTKTVNIPSPIKDFKGVFMADERLKMGNLPRRIRISGFQENWGSLQPHKWGSKKTVSIF